MYIIFRIPTNQTFIYNFGSLKLLFDNFRIRVGIPSPILVTRLTVQTYNIILI